MVAEEEVSEGEVDSEVDSEVDCEVDCEVDREVDSEVGPRGTKRVADFSFDNQVKKNKKSFILRGGTFYHCYQ